MRRNDQKQKPFNLILLGDPAAGKGTQAARLAKKYHLYNFDMGREVRRPSVRAQFDYQHTTGMGKLTPTGIARGILQGTIQRVPRGRGILFNGHPKMIGEARLAAKWLAEYDRRDPVVIYLSVPAAETLRRATKRDREDDSRKGLMNRRRYYREQVSQVVAFFKKRYQFKIISGVGDEAAVAKRIMTSVDSMLSKHD